MADGSLNKNTGEPRYMALARRLADDIREGKYPINSLLPTEAKLTSKYSISRFTVREAIRQLQSQGLVIRRQGVGTRVLADYPVRNYMQTRNTVEEVLAGARLWCWESFANLTLRVETISIWLRQPDR